MFNIFQILAAFVIALLPSVGPNYTGDPWAGGLLFATLALGVFVLTGIVASFVENAVRREARMLRTLVTEATSSPHDTSDQRQLQVYLASRREETMKRATILAFLNDGLALGALFTLYHFHDVPGLIVYGIGIPEGLDVVPRLLPWLVFMLGVWSANARITRAVRSTNIAVRAAVAFQLRTTIFGLLPVICIGFATWAISAWLRWLDLMLQSYVYLQVGLMFAAVLLLSALLPAMLRWIIGASPMPEGETLARWRMLSRRAGVRIDRVFVWRTAQAGVPTAFFVGLLPPFRYIFVSDALLDHLEDDEIDAVFMHELGHAHHRHLWFFLAFLVGFTILSDATSSVIIPWLFDAERLGGMANGMVNADTIVIAILIVMAVAYLYVGFGWISRRFERQADFFAARHTSPAHIASALNRLSMLMGGGRNRSGWRHFSIARRIRELSLLVEAPAASAPIVQRFERERRLFILGFVGVLALCLALIAPRVVDDVRTGLGTHAFLRAEDLRVGEAPDIEGARALYRESMARADWYLESFHPDAQARWVVAMNAAQAEVLAGLGNARFSSLRDQAQAEGSHHQNHAQARQAMDISIAILDREERLARHAMEQGVRLVDVYATAP